MHIFASRLFISFIWAKKQPNSASIAVDNKHRWSPAEFCDQNHDPLNTLLFRTSLIAHGIMHASFNWLKIQPMFKTNEYFDGQVKSIAFQTETLPATVGVMAKGEYEFGTSQDEKMTVVSGSLTVKLPNASGWTTYKQGEDFSVEANQTFLVKADIESAYLCLYS